MKGWRATCATLTILLSLISGCSAVRFGRGAKVMRTALKGYVKSDHGLVATNAALGSFSRSLTIGTGMQQMRQEEQAEMSYSMQMSITTLAVLDISGGVLLPIAQLVVDDILEKSLYSATKTAFDVVGPSDQLLNFIDNPKDVKAQKAAKSFMTARKAKIKATMVTDIRKVEKIGNKVLLKKINKVKKLFKLKAIGKALGPLFDVINIGMSIDSLVRTSIDCHKGPTCHVGGLVAASLGIISGIVGIVAVFVPFLAPLALVLGIAATLVEIFWQPPPPPPEVLKLEEIRFHLNADRMSGLDVYSRRQLEVANSFLRESGMDNIDLYVVNQGHFPNWMEENIAEPEEPLSGPLTFGFNEVDDYSDNGVYKETIKVAGQCTNLSLTFEDRSGDAINSNWCEYYQEGNGDLVLNSRLESAGKLYVGPDFYGASNSPPHIRTSYEGVMVLVPTDGVGDRTLVGEEGDVTYTTPVRIRGLNINTEQTRLGNVSHSHNDIVTIGDMPNLGYKVEDGGHMVIINTGNSGRDVLTIDGWVKRLEARLGSNHNTLSFRTISKSKQTERRESNDESKKKNEIKGIKFNPGSGQLIMLGYDADASNHVVEYELGHVRGVGILAASPFQDEITLFALQKDETNRDTHFTVFKYNGTATYVFDAKNHKSARFDKDSVVHFKIVDASRDYSDSSPPLLKIINMYDGAIEQDVQYRKSVIHIYSSNGNRRELASISFSTTPPAKVNARKENGEMLFPVRLLTDLDIMDYKGQRLDYDFTQTYTQPTPPSGKGRDDILYLHCPDRDVDFDGRVRSIEILVVSDVFFDECEIDDGDGDIHVTWNLEKKIMRWEFPALGKRKFRERQTFRNVGKIVNEYGTPIIDLTTKTEFYLYDTYLKHTGKDMVEESNFGDAVKDNLNMCILKEKNLNMMKRDDMPRTTEFTEEEIRNNCED